jgi:hypothetical protein
MKIIQAIITLHLAALPTAAKDIPKCTDLVDNTNPFFVDFFKRNRTCDWVGRRDTSYRCSAYDEVPGNCSRTCTLDCLSDSPSIAPSLSMSPTFSPTSLPTQSPSLSPSDFLFCDEREDNPEDFFVEGTTGNQYKSCEWAVYKQNKCSLEVVRRNCQVTCNIPCYERPEPAPFAESNTGPSPRKESFPYDIVFITIGSLAMVTIIVFVIYKRKDWFPKQKIESREIENEKKSEALAFDETDDVVDDGYIDWCGWGVKPNTNAKNSETNRNDGLKTQSL